MRPLAVVVAAAIWLPAMCESGVRGDALQASQVLDGLDFPVSLAFASDGRIFITEKLGTIRVASGGTTSTWAVLDALTEGEQGVLGLALHPEFPSSGWVYVYYTDAANDTNRVVRLVDANGVGTDLSVIVDGIPNAAFHDGGALAFAGDGTLLVSTGDVTDRANAQDLDTPAAKILRVLDDGSIPTDNPFPGNAVFTYGHRNAFGLAVDAATGDVWETENGPECNDEVNRLIAGRNYGWGPSAACASPPPPPENTNRDGPSPVRPAHWFSDPLPALTQATFYQGGRYGPENQGVLFFGGWNTGSLYRAQLASDRQAIVGVEIAYTQAGWALLDVETGIDGRLYFTAVKHDGSGGAIFVLNSLFPIGAREDHLLAFLGGGALVVSLFVIYVWRRRQLRRERS